MISKKLSDVRIARLRDEFKRSVDAASQNRFYALPDWVDDEWRQHSSQKTVICCGAGMLAGFLFYPTHRLNVAFVVDDFQAGGTVLGKPCITTEEMVAYARANPGVVCVNTGLSSISYSHFAIACRENGIPMLSFQQAIRAFQLETDYRLQDWLPYIVQNQDVLLGVEERLCDELSVETFYRLLLMHLKGDHDWMRPVQRPMPECYYRSGIFEPDDEEVFVDLGAYDGDSAREFIAATNGNFRAIHAFEPAPESFNKLVEWKQGLQAKYSFASKIQCYPMAVCDRETTLTFSSHIGLGNFNLELGAYPGQTTTVRGVRLDDAVKEPVSLIKLDLEGAECSALRGAVGHLCATKPKIASCIYHRPNDLLDTMNFLDSLGKGYQFGLRKFGVIHYDAILYAV